MTQRRSFGRTDIALCLNNRLCQKSIRRKWKQSWINQTWDFRSLRRSTDGTPKTSELISTGQTLNTVCSETELSWFMTTPGMWCLKIQGLCLWKFRISRSTIRHKLVLMTLEYWRCVIAENWCGNQYNLAREYPCGLTTMRPSNRPAQERRWPSRLSISVRISWLRSSFQRKLKISRSWPRIVPQARMESPLSQNSRQYPTAFSSSCLYP